ncbi:MAG: RluA family pseudouridine synthase [Verrucomicrobia bacterium]|nr:RluA family pseudouridine synthase [Verrucomicrobiota bacterium]
MPKPIFIELDDAEPIPILFEDRSVIAIDKPAGWMLVPHSWQRTGWNLQAAISSSISAGHYWARSRNLKFLRYIHRLDADTSGVLLFGKSFGAVETYGDLFESRQMEKRYLAIVHGRPPSEEWTCRLPLSSDPQAIGRVRVDEREGKECDTFFRALRSKGDFTLVEAHPLTGRQHQIRVHLSATGHGIMGDPLYGPSSEEMPYTRPPLALRSVELAYRDPFTRQQVRILAPTQMWLKHYGWAEHEVKPGPQPPAVPPARPKKGAAEKRGGFQRRRV